MKQGWRGGDGRMRWIVVFALLLFACSAAPVLADPSPEPVEEAAVSPTEADPADFAGPREAITEAEEAEADREAWLKSAEAAAEREESRDAFVGLGAEAAMGLLASAFEEQMNELGSDPARVLSDLEIERRLGPNGALVRDGEEDGGLVELPIPIESPLPEEEGKVDVSLVDTGAAFEPRSGLTEVVIPQFASEPIQVGPDLAVELSGVGTHSEARRFGSKDLFYPNTAQDTDTLIGPVTGGVEIFEQLRSPESPEQFRYPLSIPEGASIVSEGQGGIEIVDSAGEEIGRVPAPYAVDAQGAEVPVSMGVDGDTLVVQIPHRSSDVAYPALLDPTIMEDWANWWAGWNTDILGLWGFQLSSGYVYDAAYGCVPNWSCWGGGLYARSKGNSYWYPAGSWGQFVYQAPNTTAYISRAIFSPINGNVFNCPNPNPQGYVGIFNDYTGKYQSLGAVSPVSVANGTFDTNWVGGPGVRKAVMGITTTAPSALACAHDFYVGGTLIWEDDPENPTVSPPGGMPTKWINATDGFTISTTASDPGLGVRFVTIYPKDTAIVKQNLDNCTGLARARCPSSRNVPFNLNGSYFDEGEKSASISAEDPTGKGSNTYEWTMRVDRTPPEVTLSGQLAEATEEEGSQEVPAGKGDELSLPVYKLGILATDGSKETAAKKRSGLKDIEVFLDGKETEEPVPWEALPSCPETSCKMEQTYTLKLTDLGFGKHTLRILARDQVNNVRERKIEFEYIPATGMKDEYVMHYFPLDDGQGNESEEEFPERPELAVNVMNGNLVYRERDVDIEGPAADLEVERYYNSQLPDNDNTEWGDGWTLAQTPQLDPAAVGGGGPPSEAELVDESGALTGSVELPTQTGNEAFDPALQVTLKKEADGGYGLSDETGESAGAVVFDAAGHPEEVSAEGYTSVDYDYEGGDLSEIAVDDPASASIPSEEPEPEDEPAATLPPNYATTFGAQGTGDGQFLRPSDIVIGLNGVLWVADKDSNRIQKFNGKGEYLAKFGSLGSENGQLHRPESIAVSASGTLLVSDSDNHRIQKFNSKGEYLSKFGSQGTGNGQFKRPMGLALDASGNIWVADYDNNRIQKFSAAGTFLQAVGAKGSGAGQLSKPTDVAIAPDGNLWVADSENKRVQVFSSAGTFVKQVGSAGSGDGQFTRPTGIEIDSRGYVWVSEQGDRVQVFNQAGQFLSKFGSAGSGQGQFNFSNTTSGIAANDKGAVWIADSENDRLQKWFAPNYLAGQISAIYADEFGSNGSGDGQLSVPTDVAIDTSGNIWTVDKDNNRIQKFNAKGEFLAKFGSFGSANGQFNSPVSLVIDVVGNVWVLDRGNSRVQKFNSKGQYLSKFGSLGSANGKFFGPEGIAIDASGLIWVADTGNGRLQAFDPFGGFVKAVGSKGTAPGQLQEPTSLDAASDGRIWVTDRQTDRVSVFNEAGEFQTRFGSPGSNDGEFNRPGGIEVDAEGNVWVGDTENQRIQLFDQQGEYRAQFGSQGSGGGEFELTSPMGIAADGSRGLWITDVGNHRLQKWITGTYVPLENDFEPNDTAVDVAVSGGLVESVDGDEAGEHSYEHEGDLLTSYTGPDGETQYEYDGAGRLTKVELSNGTWATIEYKASFDRVSTVSVDPAGAAPAKTTEFEYQDSPRRTTVIPPNAPVITYDMTSDGSIFKWWSSLNPPQFDDLAGSLYGGKGTKIAPGDHNLVTQAYSPEGIASIQVIANGHSVVDETSCQQNPEVEGIECVTLVNEWVTSTENHPPGVLNLEVIITDRLGHSQSQMFWVDIPYTPPPPPGLTVAPTFGEILKFREEYGLDVVDPVANELELNDRIFDLIGAWHNPQTPGGEIARASWERWGVPLRLKDIEELEYRARYVAHDGPLIAQWGENQGESTYAGYYVDHREGGKIYVGFTSDQVTKLAAIKQQGLIAPERLVIFKTQPVWSLAELQTISTDFDQKVVAHPGVLAALTTGRLDVRANKVLLGATDTGSVDGFIHEMYGATSAIGSFFDPNAPELRNEETCLEAFHPRVREINDRLYAGDWIANLTECGCTLAFGVWEEKPNPQPNGQRVINNGALTAGHCFISGERIFRVGFYLNKGTGKKEETLLPGFGTVRRNSLGHPHAGFETDSAFIDLDRTSEVPRWIYLEDSQQKINGVTDWIPGKTLCYSGSYGHAESRSHPEISHCGPTMPTPVKWYYGGPPHWQIELLAWGAAGDSGGPVWDPATGSAVGLVTGGPEQGSPTAVTPLLPLEGKPYATEVGLGTSPGILAAPGMQGNAPWYVVDGVQ